MGGQQRVSFAYDPGNLMVSRTRVNQTVNGATHFIHDLFGNVIAEAAPTGLTQREYVYLPEGLETPAAPTAGRPLGQPGLSRPLAAFDGTGPAAHVLAIHTDQVLRPVLMTDATAAVAWRARFRPFGELISVTGPKSLDARFPGQWFQFEAGLHANWHRTYDPTLGRYLEADPLGFPDGPNRYAYVGSSPLMDVDPEGTLVIPLPFAIGLLGVGAGAGAGLAVDFGLNKLKQVICSCGKSGTSGNSDAFPPAPVAAASGAAVGLSVGIARKERTGIAGGGKSKMRTSVGSSAVHWAYNSGMLSVGMKRELRRGLRFVPGVGAGLVAGYGVYDAFQCR